MLKTIATSELRTGMFVHDLNCRWLDHPFFSSRFPVSDTAVIERIASAGIHSVVIDTDRGRDVDAARSPPGAAAPVKPAVSTGARLAAPVSVAEEVTRDRALFQEATSVVRHLMEDVRAGRQVQVATLDPLAERTVQSVLRNPHALTAVARIKTKDEYTFMHCVSVAGLLVAFARERGLPEAQMRDLAVGGLVHDVGKILVPDAVLNKPGRLTAEEFEVMKAHVTYAREVLAQVSDISRTTRDVAALHHERPDGKGYPLGLTAERISAVGRMAAIVDVYDALTSVRVYKEAWEPTQALKKLLEWSPGQFDRELVQHFIRCLGIYPVGSLVELESGLVAIVVEQGEDMLRPVVRVVYNARKSWFERVHDLDLARVPDERIRGVASSAELGINVQDFL